MACSIKKRKKKKRCD